MGKKSVRKNDETDHPGDYRLGCSGSLDQSRVGMDSGSPVWHPRNALHYQKIEEQTLRQDGMGYRFQERYNHAKMFHDIFRKDPRCILFAKPIRSTMGHGQFIDRYGIRRTCGPSNPGQASNQRVCRERIRCAAFSAEVNGSPTMTVSMVRDLS